MLFDKLVWLTVEDDTTFVFDSHVHFVVFDPNCVCVLAWLDLRRCKNVVVTPSLLEVRDDRCGKTTDAMEHALTSIMQRLTWIDHDGVSEHPCKLNTVVDQVANFAAHRNNSALVWCTGCHEGDRVAL